MTSVRDLSNLQKQNTCLSSAVESTNTRRLNAVAKFIKYAFNSHFTLSLFISQNLSNRYKRENVNVRISLFLELGSPNLRRMGTPGKGFPVTETNKVRVWNQPYPEKTMQKGTCATSNRLASFQCERHENPLRGDISLPQTVK